MKVQASEDQKQALEATNREHEQAVKQIENNFSQQLSSYHAQLSVRIIYVLFYTSVQFNEDYTTKMHINAVKIILSVHLKAQYQES